MQISYDPGKRRITLTTRGLDFDDAAHVFAGTTFEVEDTRRDYGEVRMICYGLPPQRLVVVGYVKRGTTRHIFSRRKANEREQTRFGAQLGVGHGTR